MMKYRFRRVVAGQIVMTIGTLALLNGCVSIDPADIKVTAPSALTGFPAFLHRATCVRAVTGGWDSDSPASIENFRAALTMSMEKASILAPESTCQVFIDVNLLGLSHPSMGLDIEVTTHVNYKVFNNAGQPLLLETISAPYTAKLSDALVGAVRGRLANEGSIKSNLTQFFEKLRALRPPEKEE